MADQYNSFDIVDSSKRSISDFVKNLVPDASLAYNMWMSL